MKQDRIINFTEILSRLQGVRRENGGYLALCPAHSDTNPSLSIKQADGKVLLHCHAGCKYEDILMALDLNQGDLCINQPTIDDNGHRPESKIVATYDYTDIEGKLLYQVVRYQPKSFKQRRPDGKGGYIYNLQGIEPVLYRMPDIRVAHTVNAPIFVVEGEKDAEALIKIGLYATTAPMGAGKWKPTYSDTLKGADVIILPDKDAPGRKHAEQVARSLNGTAKSIKVIELPDPDGHQIKDISDWLTAGGIKEQLLDLVNSQPVWSKVQSEVAKQEKDEVIRKPFVVVEGKLYLQVKTKDGMQFAYQEDSQVHFTKQVELSDGRSILPQLLPKGEDGDDLDLIGLPNEEVSRTKLVSPFDLMQILKYHIIKYVDLPMLDIDLCCYYIVFSWFYQKVHTLPYMRFLADTGKGKSRCLRVISELCFYPMRSSGASSFSGLARASQKWKGTLVIDEADLSGDMASQVIKYLNLGFERGQYYVLSDKQNPKIQQYFDPFMPKVIAMREPFKDNATESRLLSISPHETSNLNIPVLLPTEYEDETQTLRNQIARFVLEHFASINDTEMLSFKHLPIEPRLKQLSMPLSIVFQLWSEGVKQFEGYLMSRQKELKLQRSMSWQGSLFNTVLGIASGDIDLSRDFPDCYGTEVEAATPSMVAKYMNSTPKAVSQGLQGIGFQLELKHLGSRKVVRRYTVSSNKIWKEMVSRYYYSEDGKCPDLLPILCSNKFTVCPEVLQVLQVLPKPEVVTDVTDVTDLSTRHTGHIPPAPAQEQPSADPSEFPEPGASDGMEITVSNKVSQVSQVSQKPETVTDVTDVTDKNARRAGTIPQAADQEKTFWSSTPEFPEPGERDDIAPDDPVKLELWEIKAGIRKRQRPDGTVECEIGG